MAHSMQMEEGSGLTARVTCCATRYHLGAHGWEVMPNSTNKAVNKWHAFRPRV